MSLFDDLSGLGGPIAGLAAGNILNFALAGPSKKHAEAFGSSFAGSVVGNVAAAVLKNITGNVVQDAMLAAAEALAPETGGLSLVAEIGISFAARAATDYAVGRLAQGAVGQFDKTKLYHNMSPNKQHFYNALISSGIESYAGDALSPINAPYKTSVRSSFSKHGSYKENVVGNTASGMAYAQGHAGSMIGQASGALLAGSMLTDRPQRGHYLKKTAGHATINAGITILNGALGGKFPSVSGVTRPSNNPSINEVIMGSA